MPTWTSSPFASTAENRGGECSSIACWKMPSSHSQRAIGIQEPAKHTQYTTCSVYRTKAAIPLSRIMWCVAQRRGAILVQFSRVKPRSATSQGYRFPRPPSNKVLRPSRRTRSPFPTAARRRCLDRVSFVSVRWRNRCPRRLPVFS